MKVKNKQFRKRQNKRIAKRERHQKFIAKLMTNFGGGLSLSWQLFRIKISRKVLTSNKISKKIKMAIKNKNIIEVKIGKPEISGEK